MYQSSYTMLSPSHPFGKFGCQLHIGSSALDGHGIWHTGTTFELWSGDWRRRTPAALHAECLTIICDLEALYPSLGEQDV